MSTQNVTDSTWTDDSGVTSKSRSQSRLVTIFKRRLPLVSLICVLLIWQLGSRAINPILLPPPSDVVVAYAELLGNGEIPAAFALSLRDLVVGFGIAVVVGLFVGIVMGRYWAMERVLFPYVAFFIATPSIALIPLIIIWFGFDTRARVAVIVIGAIWPIMVNTAAGIKTTDRQLRQVSHAFRLSNSQFLRWVAIPGSIPHIMSGLKLGLGQAIVSMLVAQMTMKLVGLGGLIVSYGNAFKTSHLLAGVITAAVFGVLLTGALNFSERRFFPWIRGEAEG